MMKTINLSETELELVRDIISNDITDIAENTEFFAQCDDSPKEYMDRRIALCNRFDLNFWDVIDLNCSHFVLQRLKALYDGRSEKEFIDNYEIPSENELGRQFLNALIKNKRT